MCDKELCWAKANGTNYHDIWNTNQYLAEFINHIHILWLCSWARYTTCVLDKIPIFSSSLRYCTPHFNKKSQHAPTNWDKVWDCRSNITSVASTVTFINSFSNCPCSLSGLFTDRYLTSIIMWHNIFCGEKRYAWILIYLHCGFSYNLCIWFYKLRKIVNKIW